MPAHKPLSPPGYGAGIHPFKGGRRGAGLHPFQPRYATAMDDPVLLAEAVTRMRDKLQRSGDTANPLARRNRASKKPTNDLWSWDPEVRIGLGVDAALRALWTDGGALWLVQPRIATLKGSGKRIVGRAERLLNIDIERDDAVFAKQINTVIAMAASRDDAMAEILTQQDDVWPFFAALTHIDADAAPHTMELLAVAHGMATSVTMRIKDALACPRPVDLSARVAPCLRTPGHASVPAGHATIAFLLVSLVATLLGEVRQPGKWSTRRRMMFRLAHRISHHRVVAGLHFPVDLVAGRLLGEVLADYFLAACGERRACAGNASISVVAGKESNAALPRESQAGDGDWPQPLADACKLTLPSGALAVAAAPVLSTLWGAAVDELRQLRLR